jgi:hypothetical protein
MTVSILIETGTHKPLVTSSNLVAATIPLQSPLANQGIHQKHQTYLATEPDKWISIEMQTGKQI